MPVSQTLVSVGADHLFYLVQTTSSGGELPVFGGNMILPWGTMQTDGQTQLPGPTVVNGAFRQVLWADTDGIGLIPAGAGLTIGQARALFMLDETTNIGNNNVPLADSLITPRAGLSQWTLNGDTAGLSITATNDTATSSAYLRINLVHSIWR